MTFELLARDGGARRGRLHLSHGVVDTPVFMPVGTAACVKTLTSEDLKALGAQIILANSYHLSLRSAPELIQKAGGLHRFMNWGGSVLTDSGGFQIFSLAKLRKVTESGVVFRSHVNGDGVEFTPESVVHLQEQFGSDIHMILDECLTAEASHKDTEASMERSLRWARRSRQARRNTSLKQFGIIQGGLYEDLRERSLEELLGMGFEGMALGGLSVGEPREEMMRVCRFCLEKIPAEIPRYLMGVGTPWDLIQAISLGVDMFDCVMPTRNARNGCVFTCEGKIQIRNAKYKFDPSPLDPQCENPTYPGYSRSYLRHLFISSEITALRLLSYHNLHYYLSLMSRAREAITAGTFSELYREIESVYGGG